MIRFVKSGMMILLAWSCQSVSLLPAEDLQLAIKSPRIEVDHPLITISDLLHITGSSRIIEQTVGELDLEEIQLGQEIKLSKRQMMIRLRLAGFEPQAIQGPAQITVTRVATKSRLSNLNAKIAADISAQFGIPIEDIQVAVSESSLQRVAEKIPNMEQTTITLSTELPLGETKVRLSHSSYRGEEVGVPVECRVSVLTEMLVATRNLSRGTRLTAEDYKVVKRPLADRQLLPAAERDLQGKQTSTLIPVHGVIRLSNLQIAPRQNVVSRNDRVDLVYSTNAMTLRVQNAKVLTPGGQGDWVEVLNPVTNKRVVASVVSKSLVKVR